MEIQVDITLVCDECGDDLHARFDVKRQVVRVEPCERCLLDEREQALRQRDGEGA